LRGFDELVGNGPIKGANLFTLSAGKNPKECASRRLFSNWGYVQLVPCLTSSRPELMHARPECYKCTRLKAGLGQELLGHLPGGVAISVSPSPSNEPPRAATEEAGRAASEWVKKFELKLNQLSPDMSAASALLEQEGFRADSGNKSATGWFMTAHDSNQRRGSIKLQSDGTKIVLTVTGTTNSMPGYSP